MNTTIMSGEDYHAEALKKLEDVVSLRKRTMQDIPYLTIYCCTDNNKPSIFSKMKRKDFESCGVPVDIVQVDGGNYWSVIEKMAKESDRKIISIELPLPDNDAIEQLSEVLSKYDDIDDLDGILYDKMLPDMIQYKEYVVAPCTPKGVMALLKEYNISLKNKNALVIGRSYQLGIPMGIALMGKDATVTFAHSKTSKENLKIFCQNADIIIAASGKEGIVTGDMIKEGAVIIDVSSIDVDHEAAIGKASFITATSKCVGLYTRAENIYRYIEAVQFRH